MRLLLLAVLALLPVVAQEPPPDVSLLARIRNKIAENLKKLPNYTCTQTIVRSLRRPPSAKLRRLDAVRLEVAYVAGKEWYGWPGSGRIDQDQITRLVSGTIGNGDFAGLPSSIFLGESAQFRYQGESSLRGKRAIRYDYTVAQPASGYQIQSGSHAAIVGYHGSFWADADTLDLLRLEVCADDIPGGLKLASAVDKMEYERVSIGSSKFLLPRGAELDITDSVGGERLNRMQLEACHQYVGESALSFQDPPAEYFAAPAKPAPAAVDLPGEFTVEISLDTPIDSESSAIGDELRATLRQSISTRGTAVVPKGTKLSGHIAGMEKRKDGFFMNLAFNSIDLEPRATSLDQRENVVTTKTLEPLIFPAGRLRLARGTRFVLRSRLTSSQDKVQN